MLHHVDFEPVGRRGDAPPDRSLLETAQELGVELVTICGGEGSCGQCRVKVVSGEVSPPTWVEEQEFTAGELAGGFRLACQTYPRGDLKVDVPPESLSAPQRAQVEGLEVPVTPDPPVRSYRVQMPPASMHDLLADDLRVRSALQEQHGVYCEALDAELLRTLAPKLREWGWQADVAIRNHEAVAANRFPSRQLGLAFDLGTTKIAGYVVDLATGVTLAAKGTMNPQIAYGEDVITRLTRVRTAPAEAERMQELVVQAMNDLAVGMLAEIGAISGELLEATVVANTAMHHLFLGLPTEQLLMAPYIPAVRGALDVKAREVGLRIAPGGYLHVLPNIAGYVGADHVAMILATGIADARGVVLALDIGTNTEICLSDHGEMASVSTASGPAFEGAHIKYGMRAAEGAIEHVKVWDGRVDYKTIGGGAAVGICGSGILDALAQLYLAGVLNRSGSMGEHPRVRTESGAREFVLTDVNRSTERQARSIAVTQRDVREVQLAKAAIRAGTQILLETAGRKEEEIDRVIIAGAFGSYIDPASAVAIGMLPALPLDRFVQVGNAAGTGARLALISREQRSRAEEIARRVRYVELAAVPNFTRTFSRAIYLGQ